MLISASIAVGEQVDFSVVALTTSGDPVGDGDREWVLTDPATFTGEDSGMAPASGGSRGDSSSSGACG